MNDLQGRSRGAARPVVAAQRADLWRSLARARPWSFLRSADSGAVVGHRRTRFRDLGLHLRPASQIVHETGFEYDGWTTPAGDRNMHLEAVDGDGTAGITGGLTNQQAGG
jgi:hypothetical protein